MEDRRGEMGFAEAMLAVMAVTVVLMMYAGTLSAAVHDGGDPLDALDPDMFRCRVSDGEVLTEFEGYLGGYMSSHGLSGITAYVSVPGFADGRAVGVGGSDGMIHSRSFSIDVPGDRGRTLVAVVAVTAWS